MLVALDCNTRSVGWAVGGPDDARPRCGTWKLYGCADDDTLARSCAALYTAIADISKLLKPRYVCYEAPFNPQDAKGMTNASTVRGLLSLAAIVMAAGRNAGAVTHPVHVQSWRKTFCGHGRPEEPKAATIARCKLLGWHVNNDDEADAAGIWCHGMLLHYPKWAPNSTPLFAGRAA